LLYDIADIPYSEVQARDSVAGSLFFGGNWWVPSATNLWGIERGDSTHIALGPPGQNSTPSMPAWTPSCRWV
jgi:hypothetical protein